MCVCVNQAGGVCGLCTWLLLQTVPQINISMSALCMCACVLTVLRDTILFDAIVFIIIIMAAMK